MTFFKGEFGLDGDEGEDDDDDNDSDDDDSDDLVRSQRKERVLRLHWASLHAQGL